MKFSKIVFNVAGIYGLLVLLPQYFLENKTGSDYPPTITHPEYYYGFIGTAIAFQIVFLLIARDPVRYRQMMLASVVEKFSFAIATIILYLQGRLATMMLAAGMIDLTLGILFVIAFLKTEQRES